MKPADLIEPDYQVMDVLMDGPETISGIALESGLNAETVRRSIHRLKFFGYVTPKFLERSGQCRPAMFYELTRTRKAA